jgi:hypothetical protein
MIANFPTFGANVPPIRFAQKTSIQCWLLGIFLLFANHLVDAQVSGTVYKDFNASGVKDNSTTYNEPGMAGVVVKAFKPDGSALTVAYTGGGTSTNSTGGYTVTGGTLGQIRLEFAMPDNFTFASSGASGGTTVTFPSGATQDLAVNYPGQYIDSTNPNIITTCFVNGDPDATGANGPSSVDTIVKLPYNSTGTSPTVTKMSIADISGSVWGVAHQRSSGRTITAAFVKRHVGLGSLGAAGLYITNGTTTSNFVNLATIGVAAGGTNLTQANRNLPADKTQPSADPLAFDAVGKAGLGDIEFSEDEETLYVVSLGDRSVYKMTVGIPAAAPTSATKLAAAPWISITDARPFGLKIFKGKLYVGVVETGENSTTMVGKKAYVMPMTKLLEPGLQL